MRIAVLERVVKVQLQIAPAWFVPVTKRHTGTRRAYVPRQEVWGGAGSEPATQIEVAVANGKTTAQACKEAEIVEQTYFRWRKEYGGLQVDQAKRLKELEHENAKLKRLVAELSLDKLVLKDIASGNF
ncbi:transposase [Edaphobacter modestus]|uniref:Transposase n=1 Tax=Edaphobacter modestus TaxID=388466 RepID=A0A4Q7YYJ0_9BACT|nr:transposase [Edaphobacter modestus]